MPARQDARFARAEEAETPYRRAQEMWDRRMGAAFQQAAGWRRVALAAFGLCGLLGAACLALALRPASAPFVIATDASGEARPLGLAAPAAAPSDAQIAYQLARFVEMVRGLPSDPVVLRQNWLRAYDFATQQGAQALNALGAESDPKSRIGRETVAVEIVSVVRASPRSFAIRWRERTYAGGIVTADARYSGVAELLIEPSTDPDVLARNPLGLYVHAFSWSKDLTP